MSPQAPVIVRPSRMEDLPEIIAACREVYPASPPWTTEQLTSHLEVFPEGQFVALLPETGRVVGVASSLIILWNDYDVAMNWRDFTDHGTFRNHDPVNGRTLYGAEVMVIPGLQGRGIGKALYAARQQLVERRGLLRIRAGARLRGFHRQASAMAADEYVSRVAKAELGDPTLSFQLKQGFRVLDVIPNYLRNDPESLGFAAVIEWLNRTAASRSEIEAHDRLPGIVAPIG